MIVCKNGIKASIQPSFLEVYLKEGWVEYAEEIQGRVENPEVEETEIKKCSEEELAMMKTSDIKKLGTKLGYSITAIKQTDCVKQFLEQQG